MSDPLQQSEESPGAASTASSVAPRKPQYRPAPPHVSFPELEAAVAARWATHDVFHRTLSERAGAEEWVFYEGPPTANNKPGIHHVEPRAFKDVFCRWQVMRGRYVHRKAGWDCHGLPVEIEVEKELGITQKRDIEEKVGIEEFVRRCRSSVQRYVEDHARLTERIGFWVDQDDAYWTMSPEYIETVWWLLKQIWDKGLLEEDFKVVPYCPRCETSLSSHEQHQTGAYQDVSDTSVFVRFRLADEPDTSLLVWTTTPWTLLANMAVAAGPELDYAKIEDPGRPGEFLILARERVPDVAGENAVVIQEVSGQDLTGRRYIPPFDFVATTEPAHRVVNGAFVTTSEGTGLVHLAPYGEDDMAVAKRDGLPIEAMVDASGKIVSRGGRFAGLWVKDADPEIAADLDERGLLLRAEPYEHAYPHCWRCGTPLLYYPRKDWYIRTSHIRSRLQASNEATSWQPPSIKYGRFGDWLANNVDWSLSRDRYWGTPLPIWRCERDHATCVGSLAELAELAGRDISEIDPHRPYIDEVTGTCPQCGQEAGRVPSVIDAWFDSGAMPFAQWHYPFENEDIFEKRFPADFISEAIDQTRGWFYSLLAVSTLIRDETSYRNVVCLGHIVDAAGRKMSKSLGNVIEPWSVLDVQGADGLRWYLLTSGTPWSPRRVSAELIQESVRKYLLTLWNTYSFWVTYASLESFDPSTHEIPVADRPELDRWILAELDDAVREVTGALEEFDATRGGRRLDSLVDDLSNWYVRRSRRRFYKSEQDFEARCAFLTLWECLTTIAKLTAPYTPFIADEIFTNLMGDTEGARSVHLELWPEPDGARVDDGLRTRMALVRRLVALGRSARTEAKVRVRQPLARALVVLPAHEASELTELQALLSEELNVKRIEIAQGVEELVSYSVKPNYKALGPRFGPRIKEVAAALDRAEAAEVVRSLETAGRVELSLGEERIALTRDDLDVRVEGRTGFALAQEGAYGVALDLELTTELIGEGVAREVVRAVQDLRKSSGLAVEDRIELWMRSGAPELAAALNAHERWIATEVLAVRTHVGQEPAEGEPTEVNIEAGTIEIALARTTTG